MLRTPGRFVCLLLAIAFLSPARGQETTSARARRSKPVMGTITKVESGALTVKPRFGGKDVRIDIEENAKVTLDGVDAALKQAAVGMAAVVIPAAIEPGKPERQSIFLVSAGRDGHVTKIDGKKITLQPSLGFGNAVTIETDGQTKILFYGLDERGRVVEPKEMKLSDLTPEHAVRVTPATGIARAIHVSRIPLARGRIEVIVKSIDAKSITIARRSRPEEDKPEQTLTINASTQFMSMRKTGEQQRTDGGPPIRSYAAPEPAKAADIKEGSRVLLSIDVDRATEIILLQDAGKPTDEVKK